MLVTPYPNWFGFQFDNWDASPSATSGGTVTSGGSINTESATPLVLATAAQLTTDIYGIELFIHSSSGTGSRTMVFDIGVDNAGGTSYTYIINNVICGNSSGPASGVGSGLHFYFPIFVKAGSQVAIRTLCQQASITSRVMAIFYGQPTRPELVKVGQFSETIGTITNSLGVSFTPGNAADGTYVSLGTTTNNLWWWQLGYQVDNGTITAEYTWVELAWGDASNKHRIMRAFHGGTTAELNGDMAAANKSPRCYCPVPAGANIYVRGRCTNAPDTGYNAMALGIGG